MPLYMDRHFVEGATHHTIAHAHEMDLNIQHKHGVKFLTYWFDEERSTAFCLIESPDKDTIQAAHDEVHSLCRDPEISFADLGEITPKGFETAVRVYTVDWR